MRAAAIVVVNVITVSRVILAIMCVMAMHRLDWNTAWWLFLSAAMTDILDGYLARRWNAVTHAGAYIDSYIDVITCWLIVWGWFWTTHVHNIAPFFRISPVIAVVLWALALIVLIMPSGSLVVNRSSKKYWVRHGPFWYGMIPLAFVGIFVLKMAGHTAIFSIPLAILGLWHPMRKHIR